CAGENEGTSSQASISKYPVKAHDAVEGVRKPIKIAGDDIEFAEELLHGISNHHVSIVSHPPRDLADTSRWIQECLRNLQYPSEPHPEPPIAGVLQGAPTLPSSVRNGLSMLCPARRVSAVAGSI